MIYWLFLASFMPQGLCYLWVKILTTLNEHLKSLISDFGPKKAAVLSRKSIWNELCFWSCWWNAVTCVELATSQPLFAKCRENLFFLQNSNVKSFWDMTCMWNRSHQLSNIQNRCCIGILRFPLLWFVTTFSDWVVFTSNSTPWKSKDH